MMWKKFLNCGIGFVVLCGSCWGAAGEQVMIDNPRARATFAMATTGAAYFSLMNHSNSAITLTEVKVSPKVAIEAQIHTTIMDGDVMKMRQLVDGVEIKPGATVEFTPGGKHIMLMGLVNPLREGEMFTLVLVFSDGTSRKLEVPVGGAKKGTAGHHHHE